MNYYYLVASLPSLQLSAEPPMTCDEFRARAAEQLTAADLRELDALLAGEGSSSFGRAFVRREAALRHALALRRAEVRGRDSQSLRDSGMEPDSELAGLVADRLVDAGGAAVFGETMEWLGAEHVLAARAQTPEVGRAIVDAVAQRERWAAATGEDLTGNNPGAENIRGGLSSIEEKSLGAMAKAGTSNLTAVYDYAEPVTEKGFVFMDTPGYDPVSATGQVAGGANLICFTTGRGSVYGCKPSPSLKLASQQVMR
jgi:altronate hydrolase